MLCRGKSGPYELTLRSVKTHEQQIASFPGTWIRAFQSVPRHGASAWPSIRRVSSADPSRLNDPISSSENATTLSELGEHRTQITPGLMSAPDLGHVRGLRLDQLMLLSTIGLVVLIISLLAGVYAWSTSGQFSRISQTYNERIQAQARELGQTLSHTLSLTTASALRDSNFSLLEEVAKKILANNPNVLRVEIIDPEGRVVADSDAGAEVGRVSERAAERLSRTSTYGGVPVFEYQEPIDYGSQEGQGVVAISYSLEKVQSELRAIELEKRDSVQTAWLRTAGLGIGFVVLAGLLAAFQSRRITRPLSALTHGALDLSSGNLEARVRADGRAGREVSTLGTVFNHMAERMSYLVEDARQKAVLEREMALARTVQEALLPGRDPLVLGGLRVAGLVSTADACGGDWWLRSAIDGRRLVLGVGDVTGHGLAPALVATSATAGFAAAIRMRRPEELSAQMLITSLNQTLHQVGRGEHQMSCALALFDLVTGEVDVAAGAHPSAIVFNRNSGQLGSLLVRGGLLGAAPDAQYTSKKFTLRPGDVVVWFTDGVTESENTQRVQYGSQRLLQCIRDNAQLPAERLRDALLFDVRQYMGTQPQADDITIVVAEFTATGANA